MDAIMHILGLCGDTHAHLDLLDILLMSGVPISMIIKYNWNRILTLFKKNRDGE